MNLRLRGRNRYGLTFNRTAKSYVPPPLGKHYLFNILRRSAFLSDTRFLPANSDQFITIVAAIVFRPILYSAENIK